MTVNEITLFEETPTAALVAENDLIPALQSWKVQAGRWLENGSVLESQRTQHDQMLASPTFRLAGGRIYTFHFSVNIVGTGGVTFGLQDSKGRNWIRQRSVEGHGPKNRQLHLAVNETGFYRFVIANFQLQNPDVTVIKDIGISVSSIPFNTSSEFALTDGDTFLPHWGKTKRTIHALCKGSRFWNTVVAAVELRLGREELLSLPQYMALCPTGQCNALCAFCSVTINRTGIIKQQLPFEKLGQFLSPVAKTIRMYGLEGNGEPSLYKRFDELVEILTAEGATFYLITNGERLATEQIDLMLAHSIDAVNFSLNAATAETHRQVMKLKDFDRVKANIKRFVTERSAPWVPMVSVSFVVHQDNIHEAQAFLQLAEQELGVDRVLVRPLSELGNELGAAEDTRQLVPYQSDVQDMLDNIQEYLNDVPRQAEIIVEPDTFRAYRPDPFDRLVMPRGYEDRLLAPRRQHWQILHPDLRVEWSLNRVQLTCPAHSAAGELWRSAPIPVEAGRTLTFKSRIQSNSVPSVITILDPEGHVLGQQEIMSSETQQEITLSVDTKNHSYLQLLFEYKGGPLNAQIDFERLRTPGQVLNQSFKLPHPRRWEIASPGARVKWEGNCVHVRWAGQPGYYLLKSYSVPCHPHQALALPVKVRVNSGRLVIGVLSADYQRWTHTFPFGEGDHEAVLEINPQENHQLQIVLYAQGDNPLDARVDWQNNLGELPPHIAGKPSSESSTFLSEERQNTSPWSGFVTSPKTTRQTLAARLRRWLVGPVKIYCHKPWTDLHNFSVDGRMDVCCIATGASQERYAWGNLLTESFQEVWNGERAREFRRTVNGNDPLPPCKRCPMSHAYQGPFFDPTHTVGSAQKILQTRLGHRLGNLAYLPLHWVLNLVVFRGFKR